MPPPSLKALAALRALADLRWQEERRALAEAQRETAARQAALDGLAARRERERDGVEAALESFETAAAAAKFEGWAKRRTRGLTQEVQAAEEAEQAARDKAAEEYGRVRALDHVTERARKEHKRLRRAADERDGQPES